VGAYDNSWESFAEKYVDGLLIADMSLALASAFVIMVAIMLHTQSPLITLLGILQIILSFPVSYFFYSIVLGLSYFPFLNFIGVFVVFALGAGDIFVAFDKWTNYRKNNKTKSTEYVAAHALPEALSAMFLTTLTTALAFFATAVCPVTPIKMFAIFSGLLIIFDYILTVGFVFPGLCIMDRALIKRSSGEHTGGFFFVLAGLCGLRYLFFVLFPYYLL
jgi:predicted RND superfamily exporter protein